MRLFDIAKNSIRNAVACQLTVPLLLIGALAVPPVCWSGVAEVGSELRVCADPDNLPFSNDRSEGFENKIAEAIAKEFGARIQYTWHPERRGFIRETLKAGKCDLVIGIPTGYEPVLSTKPYYRSTYVFVSRSKRNFGINSFDDPKLRDAKIGIHAFGDDGANSPPAHALARRGIVNNIVGFTILNTAASPAGSIIGAVAGGRVDVAIVWGPFAGYYAERQSVKLDIVPVNAMPRDQMLPFAYSISMGVRRGDDALKDRLESAIDRRHSEIKKILEEYGVPLLEGAPLAL
jgi:quinoprotein dehydrogenase-associated probable ABC transporter substrate-binding protein